MTETSRAAADREVVISYARNDGSALAEQLEHWIRQHGFEPWRDLREMVAGDEWWRQLRERIEAAHAMVAIVTKAALASAVVRREVGVARRAGTPLLPVCTDPSVLRNSPRWMADLDVIVIDASAADASAQALARLLAQLRDPPPRRPVVAMAPPLPPHHVSRSELCNRIKARLLDNDGTGQNVPVVLFGAGGFGKTTLAQEVCLDDDIAAGYPGGVGWVTVGKEDGRGQAAVLSELAGTLLGQEVRFVTSEQARRRLVEILSERRCLVALDDVWEPSMVDALRGGMAGLLITSREPEVAALDPLGPISVERLDDDQARRLLRYALEVGDLAANVSARVERLLALLDGWPLIVSLAGAAIRRRMVALGSTHAEAMDWFCSGFERRGPASADSARSHDRTHSLRASVDLSLTLFGDADRQRVLELAALPGGTAHPLDAVRRLWSATAGMAADESDTLLAKLNGHFLQITRINPSRPAMLIVHDVMRSHFGALLGEKALRSTHQTFLNSIGNTEMSWAVRVTDRFTAETLAHHLLGAGRAQELVELLTANQSWLRRSTALTGSPASFVADVQRVVGHASDVADPTTLAALHAASTTARVSSTAIPDAALAVFVRIGEDDRALNLARLRISAYERCHALRTIIDAAPPDWPHRDATLGDFEYNALAIGDERQACLALEEVVIRRLAQGELASAERAARRAPLSWSKSELLSRVIYAHLERGNIDAARRLLPDVEYFRPRSEALIAIAIAEEAVAHDATALFEEATALLEGFGNFKDQAITAVCRRLGRARRIDRVNTMLVRFGNDEYQGLALVAAARGVVESAQPDAAIELLEQAEQLMERCSYPLSRDRVVREAAAVWAALGNDAKAMRLVRSTSYPRTTAKYLALELAEAGRIDLAERLVSNAVAKNDRPDVLLAVLRGHTRKCEAEAARTLARALYISAAPETAVAIVAALAQVDPTLASELAAAIDGRESRGQARLATAVELARKSPAAATTLLATALEDIGDAGARAGLDKALAPVAAALAAAGDAAAAERVALLATDDRRSPYPNPRIVALGRAATAIAQTGDLASARRLAQNARAFDQQCIERDLLPIRAQRGDLDGAVASVAEVEELYRLFPLERVLEEVVRARGADQALVLWRRLAPTKYAAHEGDARARFAVTAAKCGDIAGALKFSKPVEHALAGDNAHLSVSSVVDFLLADLAVVVHRAGWRDDARRLAGLADRRPRFEDAWQAAMLAGTGQVDEIDRRLADSNDLVTLATLWCAAGNTLDEGGQSDEAERAFARAEEPAVRSGQQEDVLGIGRLPEGKRDPLLALAAARARRGQWSHAFRLLGVTTPGEFVEQVTEWLIACGDLDSEGTAAGVRRVLEIMSWTGPTWAAVGRAASVS